MPGPVDIRPLRFRRDPHASTARAPAPTVLSRVSGVGHDMKQPLPWSSGNIFEDIGDVVSDAGDAVMNVTAPVRNFVDDVTRAIPGSQWVSEKVRDFANTGVGSMLLKGIATTMSGGLGLVAFSIPGVIQGKKFGEAWLSEFSGRVLQTASILGSEYAKEALTDAFKQAGDFLVESAKTNFPDVPVAEGLKMLDITPQELAKQLGIREDVAAMAIELAKGLKLIDVERDYDLETGNLKPLAQRLAEGSTLQRAVAPAGVTTVATRMPMSNAPQVTFKLRTDVGPIRSAMSSLTSATSATRPSLRTMAMTPEGAPAPAFSDAPAPPSQASADDAAAMARAEAKAEQEGPSGGGDGNRNLKLAAAGLGLAAVAYWWWSSRSG